jgi:hypothetical protein
MKMVSRIVVLLTSLVVRLLPLNLFPTWILRATFPFSSGLRLVTFSSHILLISPIFEVRTSMIFFRPMFSPVKKPRSETLKFPSSDFYSAIDTVNNFF